MDYSNYTVFEIVKYEMEFLECLEYSMTTYEFNEKDIRIRYNYLKNELTKGTYKDIVSSLFSSYRMLNSPLFIFIKKNNIKKMRRMITKGEIALLINYNEQIIDGFETLKYILKNFTDEDQILKKLNSKVKDIIEITNNYFYNFLIFNTVNIYLKYLYANTNSNDLRRIFSIMNYCNKHKDCSSSIELMNNNYDENSFSKELEKLSNNCLKLEKEKQQKFNELVNIITNHAKNSNN